MYELLVIVSRTVRLVLSAAQFLMFVRAIMSFLPIDEEGGLPGLVFNLTEVFISPVRALVERTPLGEGSPFDISFFITFLIITLLDVFLPIL